MLFFWRPADLSLRSEGSAMSLSPPALDSAVGVELTSLWLTQVQQGNGTAFCALHTYETSTTGERLMASQHPASYVSCWLTQEMYYQYISKFRDSKDVPFAYLGLR